MKRTMYPLEPGRQAATVADQYIEQEEEFRRRSELLLDRARAIGRAIEARVGRVIRDKGPQDLQGTF
jgi:hypothetical protein